MDPHAHPGPVAAAYASRRQAWEAEHLSPLAAPTYPPRRRRPEPDCGLRTPLQRDRDRIVHAKAFRRLMHKTQVFVAPEGDHFRTRLTHTLEVTQISRTVARALALNEDLTEAIGLGHDLGHAPFGHIGEAVLDRCLRERFGRGFRHFEHSLRVVDRLEGDGAGLNLCDDVRDGILCHSGRAPMPRTLEGRIVRIVDRVAYLNHDIDDARRAGVLREEDLPQGPIAVLGTTGSGGSTRSCTTWSRSRWPPGTSSRARGRRGDGRAAHVHVRPRLPRAPRPARAGQGRGRHQHAVRPLPPGAGRPARRGRGA
jgi:dGTPase